MSFDLDKKEFDEAIQDKNYDWVWSAYEALRKECESWKEQCLGKHTDPKDCPSWYDWCNCGGGLAERIELLQKEVKKFRLALQEIRQVEITEDYSCWDDKHDSNNPCCIAYRALK